MNQASSKKLFSLATAALAVLLASPLLVAEAKERSIISGRATVWDGDTIKFGKQRIRLWGMDAPEKSQRCGELQAGTLAYIALHKIAEGKEAVCEVRGRSRGRPVALCRVDGLDLGERMVAEGWAENSPEFSKGEYADEEADARSHKWGVWAADCERPSEFRARMKAEAVARRKAKH